MAKLGVLGFVLTLAGLVFAATTAAPQEALAGKACVTASFQTTAIEKACKKGGQAEAKKEMKKFLKAAKKKQANIECKTCHSKLAPSYDLKPDGLTKYRDLGGK